jgi:hypothetical protein
MALLLLLLSAVDVTALADENGLLATEPNINVGAAADLLLLRPVKD